MQGELARGMKTAGWAVLRVIREWWLSLLSRLSNLSVPGSNAAHLPGWANG